MEDIFIELIQVALGTRKCLSRIPNEQEWKKLSVLCHKQTISCIVFQALDSLSIYGQKAPLTVLYEWIGYVQTIESRNHLVNKRCVEIVREFKTGGFETCILKGQGNAVMYPNPLLRTPGDIDLWVKPEVRGKKLEVRNVIKYVKGRNPKARAEYHHMDYGDFNRVEVEVHYRPTFMNNLIANRRLQRWMIDHADEQLSNQITLISQDGRISVPTWEFNVVFQLSHIYRHVIQEGIGLRQMIDYFYLLKSDGRSKMDDVSNTLRYLRLEKIAGAMMWVMNEVLGLSEEYLIAPKDEKRGRILLAEIMKGGNFGHYVAENQKANNAIKKNLQRVKRDIRLVRYFPSECLWEPVFRLYHWFWRLRYN